jgi:hypothetical protein
VGGGVPAQGGEHRRRLLAAAGHDHGDGNALDPVGDVREHAERSAVGPMSVVDEQGERPFRGQVGRQPVEGMARRERVVGGHRRILDPKDRRGGSRSAGEQRGRRLAQDLVEELADDAEGEGPLQLGAAGSQRQQPGICRPGPRRLQQARLPDAGRPVDGQQPTGTVGRLLQRASDRAELAVALEQPRGPGVVLECQRQTLPLET